ncbi:hypothetical protein HBI52_160030 [Parastagonospora nodorum]|nr:hypothetical protein HBI52_160030 [Parastagonospora nodorum]
MASPELALIPRLPRASNCSAHDDSPVSGINVSLALGIAVHAAALSVAVKCNGQPGAAFTQAFNGKDSISWMYDWEAVIDSTPRSDLEYVPLLHSNQQWCTEGWEQNVANARAKYQPWIGYIDDIS